MRRRQFLKAGVAGSCAYLAAGGISLTHSRNANAAVVSISVEAVAFQKRVSPASQTIPKNALIWQFIHSLTEGIVVWENDLVSLSVKNSITTHSIKLTIPGITQLTSPIVAPGETALFEFTALKAGSYVIYDEQNGLLGRAMGLTMPLIVLPGDAGSGLYSGAPSNHSYLGEYPLMLSEIDSRINDAVEAGLPVDMDSYQPDYFFVNGLSYPDTVYDANGFIDDSKVILMSTGEQVAIRFINGGLIYYPMHFHGYHVDVVLRNRFIQDSIVEKDTVLVKPGECVDCILNVGEQTGLYPLHTHYVPGVTSAGSYAGGALLMLKSVVAV